jgi:hypothetical protein
MIMEKKKSINDIDPKGNNSEISRDIPEENITSEQIEQSEIAQNEYEVERGEGPFEGVSNAHMDDSPESKGNLGVNRSSQTQYEKEKYNKEAENVRGGPDTGSGRASGSDRA